MSKRRPPDGYIVYSPKFGLKRMAPDGVLYWCSLYSRLTVFRTRSQAKAAIARTLRYARGKGYQNWIDSGYWIYSLRLPRTRP